MSSPQEGPNPLRPYYIPPSIGIPPEAAAPSTHNISKPNGSAASYASSARDIFSDIDYSDYLSDNSPSSVEQLKSLLDQALYKYTSILLAQPFEVAKTLLQVRSQASGDGTIAANAGDDLEKTSNPYRDDAYVGICSLERWLCY
jgi:fusion and transport protein UGO1